MYCNPEVLNLFCHYKYKVFPTGSDASRKNSPVKHGHRIIATSIHMLLFRSGLPIKFWLYAFFHVIQIINALLHRNQTASPLYLATGKKNRRISRISALLLIMSLSICLASRGNVSNKMHSKESSWVMFYILIGSLFTMMRVLVR